MTYGRTDKLGPRRIFLAKKPGEPLVRDTIEPKTDRDILDHRNLLPLLVMHTLVQFIGTIRHYVFRELGAVYRSDSALLTQTRCHLYR
jgi:hypothetical protein